eukprot:1140308-Pelagomonas_calceolata.AAC.5
MVQQDVLGLQITRDALRLKLVENIAKKMRVLEHMHCVWAHADAAGCSQAQDCGKHSEENVSSGKHARECVCVCARARSDACVRMRMQQDALRLKIVENIAKKT